MVTSLVEVKERPILFSTDMVKAILDNRKTMTRRVIKLDGFDGDDPYYETRDGDLVPTDEMCPYGKVGDRLWVRETHWISPQGKVYYYADWETKQDMKWTPSIFMPRWASRILLEILDIRVERLQMIDIYRSDAEAEGSYIATDTDDEGGFINLWNRLNEKRGYGWDKNPWVWVIEFIRVIPCKLVPI